MDITKVTFPLYKLRAYINIDRSPLGLIKISTIKGTYILDDLSINGTFPERRARLISEWPRDKIYKLNEQVIYLRQLVKYKSGTTFIDHNGNIVRYTKSSELYKITSHKIIEKRESGNWTIIKLNGIEIPLLVSMRLTPETKYASIMHTKWGPFLYDLTSKQHEIYKRKI